MKILIAEDETELRNAIAEGLRMDGYAVDTCDNGETASQLCFAETYDLMILDLNLPKLDGFEVLAELRQHNAELKILILSARTSVLDKVKGLDYGANDYLTKPFEFAELEARIRNLLRRNFVQQDNILSYDRVKLDLSKHQVWVDGTLMNLTKKEFSILQYFLMNPDKVISQEELMAHVWDSQVNSLSGAIRVHIASLRKKLVHLLGYDLIYTKIGAGYYLAGKDGM
ncbi:response regulator transcription factor [Isobaculum melis]|uniref:DNA-binding response regulator, OmpR family, contains REC and winged-helix (WHTH) domain n=1 Tax=Isobaculum melis TaxID=142588 RepID=A0A1H9SFB4_9LACT|nr:response regulator transcription factor [Isobaculum melis]SER83710.1 DNA-binding response regulator, OmpR family, contains REC and winged-helix (wHTH) domain [Isobaculum melis]